MLSLAVRMIPCDATDSIPTQCFESSIHRHTKRPPHDARRHVPDRPRAAPCRASAWRNAGRPKSSPARVRVAHAVSRVDMICLTCIFGETKQ